MNKKLVIFEDESNNEPVAAMISGPGDDPVADFEAACADARKDVCTEFNYNIPKKYLKPRKITLKILDTVIRPIEIIGSNPVSLCQCRECSAYEEGNCFRYGGTVDGFATLDVIDCIHGTCGVNLIYDDECVSYIFINTDLTPYETAKYIYEVTDEELSIIKEDIKDYFNDRNDGTTFENSDPDLWNFKEDAG